MCNAWNHPPGCTCGWGGEGHLGGGGGLGSPVPDYRVAVSHFSSASSFTNPNARCPVCGASVFFYKSPYGGRVFFDELGPPWPKHPCTDNQTNYSTVFSTSSAIPTKTYQWQTDGWKPLIQVKLEKVRSNIYRVSTTDNFVAFIKCNSARLHKPQPDFAQLRSASSVMVVSLYWLNGGVREFKCHNTVDEALNSQ